MTTDLITLSVSALGSLKDVISAAMDSSYDIKVMMRFPARSDRFPVIFIVPEEIIPQYMDRTETLENGDLNIRLVIAVKTPFDDDGTKLLEDLDTLVNALWNVRHDKTKWLKLDYLRGIKISTAEIDKYILQSCDIAIRIKVN